MGNSYTPTFDVKIYYAATDVKTEYETMGHAEKTCTNVDKYIDITKNEIIEFAKEQGADAIIFDKIEVISVDKDERAVLKASFIKFK